MSIISLSGRAGVGKDEAASIIQKLTTPPRAIPKDNYKIYCQPTSPWIVKKWAGPLRKVSAILLNMDEKYLYTREFKENTLPPEWDYYTACCEMELDAYVTPDLKCSNCGDPATRHQMTGRYFLQHAGTNAIRNGLHPDAWVNALMGGYKANVDEAYPSWIISDTRFPNELQDVKDRDGISIRINRGNSSSEGLHHSETALDDAEFDWVIDNNGPIEHLEGSLRAILLAEGILK